MILTDCHRRLVLWGAEVHDNRVTAGLVFISSSYSQSNPTLYDYYTKKEVTKVTIDTKYLSSNFPHALTNSQFEI